jgi:3-hydroxyisobutyrate dehydrogenase
LPRPCVPLILVRWARRYGIAGLTRKRLSRRAVIAYRPARMDAWGESRMRIGVAGIGKMGAAIAARLIEAGHDVAVWNRTAEKARAVAGAALANTPADLAERSDAIITILTDAAALDAVYRGSSGLIGGDVRGKLFIEMSTVLPAAEVALADAARAKGAAFVECPVGGSTGPARQGKLIGLMGAEDAEAARARPILEQLCRRIEHAGPVGSGALLKFAVNLPLMVYWQALGEALALTRELTIDPARILDLLTETSGGPNVLKVRGPGVAAMLKGAEAGPVTFNIDGGIKDMQSMLAEAKVHGIDLPLVERTLGCYEETKRHRSGAAEVSTVSVYWATRNKR